MKQNFTNQNSATNLLINLSKKTFFKLFVFFSIILLQNYKLRADCSLSGTVQIANLAAACPTGGILTIPDGATLNLSSTTAFPSNITEIVVQNGGSIEVNVDYTFPATLLKIRLLDADFVAPSTAGPSPSGRINVDNANSTLYLQDNTQLIIQNIFTPVGFNNGAAITVQAMNGNCGQSVLIYLGSVAYAGCQNSQGGGVCFSFNDVIEAGGTPQINPTITLNGIITNNGTGIACNNVPFDLKATINTNNSNYVVQNYNWTQTSPMSPLATITNGNTDSPTITATPGTYTFKVTSQIQITGGACGTNSALIVTVTASITIEVRPNPSATISGTASVCQNSSPVPNITITNTNTTLAENIVYSINGMNQPAINLAPNTSTNIAVPTNVAGTFTYALVSAGYAELPNCTTTLVGNSVITVAESSVISGSIKIGALSGSDATDLAGVAFVSLAKVSDNTIISTAGVNALGKYTLPEVCDGEYFLVLHTSAGGSITPVVPLLNVGYLSFIAEGPANGMGDATADGKAKITITAGVASYPGAKVAANADLSFALKQGNLPVRLVSFNGAPKENTIELKWNTASESNFSHFQIEKSTNNRSFEIIGTLKGNENSNESIIYSFVDQNITNEKNYYRLKMVDLDETFEYSKIIFVKNEIKKSTVGNFYPNPRLGSEVTIDINSSSNYKWMITAYDLTGKLVSAETKILDAGLNKVIVNIPNSKSVLIFKFENNEGVQYRKLNN